MVKKRLLLLNKIFWQNPSDVPSKWVAYLLFVAQLLYVVARDILGGQIKFRAASLSYTTLLTLVPLLALIFAILKTVDAHQVAEPILLNLLSPLGEKGADFGQQAINYIENINVRVLGFIGSIILLYLALSLIKQMEDAYNAIWHLENIRHIFRRLIIYVSYILIGPLLVFTVIAIDAVIASIPYVQEIQNLEGMNVVERNFNKFIPYLFIIAAASLSYFMLTNTKIKISIALLGGVFTGGLWWLSAWIFASFIMTSANYQAIYSGFAIIILFLVWLQISWVILLTGASIAFYLQHPEKIMRSIKKTR